MEGLRLVEEVDVLVVKVAVFKPQRIQRSRIAGEQGPSISCCQLAVS